MGAAGAGIGLCLGAFQTVQENSAAWDAEHATVATMVIQVAAGALIGGVFIGLLTLYWARRLRPSANLTAAARQRPRPAPDRPNIPAAPIKYGPRHGLILLFALALLVGGAVILRACLMHPTVYGLLRGGCGAIFLMGLGGYLIWDDFIAPKLGRLDNRL
jgi:hypothetical protein